MKFFHESDSVVLFPVEENGLTIDDVLIKNQISVRLMRKLKKLQQYEICAEAQYIFKVFHLLEFNSSTCLPICLSKAL